jgi:putative peptidoglycan lipid II flippase
MTRRLTLQLHPSKRDAHSVPANASAVSGSAFKGFAGGVFTLAAGLASQVLVAAMFGAGAAMDAYLTSVVVPTYLTYVFTSGLSFVLIPSFIKEETAGSEDDAWSLVGTVFWIAAGILTIIALLGVVFAGQIVAATAPGLTAGKAALAARMLAVSMLTVPFVGLGSLTGGIQNARSRFFWPASAQAVGTVGQICSILVLYRSVGPMSLAWGNLACAVLAGLVRIIPVVHHGWKRLLHLDDARVRNLGPLVVPFLVFGLITQSVTIFERYFASGLPDGDLSYLGYAGRISAVFVPLIAVSIASAMFPAMAREYAQRGRSGLVEQTEFGLRLSLATAIPAVLITGALALPLVTVLYRRGAFTHEASVHVASIVAIVMVGDVLLRMIGNISSRALYVIKDTLTFPLLNALGVLLYVPLARMMVPAFHYVGLAVALPLAMSATNLAVLVIMARKLRPFGLSNVGRWLTVYLAAGLVAAGAARLVAAELSSMSALFQACAGFLVAGTVYAAILFRFDREIAVWLFQMLGSKLILRALRARLGPKSSAKNSSAMG